MDLAKIRPADASTASRFLSETGSKELLARHGIETVKGRVCASPDDAVRAAAVIGYPIVMKVVSPELTHKSDVGGVRTGITNESEVRNAYQSIFASVYAARPDAFIAGVLVEEMAHGLELLIGASRTEFGPMLVFGSGGVLVELMRDVAYRLLPMRRAEALDMIRSLPIFPLLQGYRGAAAIDLDLTTDVVLKVASIMETQPEVLELDINPLFACSDRVVVADARIRLAKHVHETSERTRERSNVALKSLFAPSGIAVVGVKSGQYNRARAWMGHAKRGGYNGRLSAVSRNDAIGDFPTYASLRDIPDTPDLVMIEVGRNSVAPVVRDCVDLCVPWVVIHASGYAESGTEEGRTRLLELQKLVDGTATRFVGPSSLGPYCPRSGLLPSSLATDQAGGLAILSQSGATFTSLAGVFKDKSVGVSKGLSYGSEGDLRLDELLNFLATDIKTEVVAVYLEGVRDPLAFRDALERCASVKPVVFLKGGMTEAGSRAAASHSGALTGAAEVWSELARKSGAIMARSIEELVDLCVAFTLVRSRVGRNVAIVTPSGAAAVLYSDSCFRHGFQVPDLTTSARQAMQSVLSTGASAANPIDVGNGYFRRDVVANVLDALSQDGSISTVLFHIAMDVFSTTAGFASWATEAFLDALIAANGKGKALVGILPYTVDDALRASVERRLLSAGLPVFATVDRALAALASVETYQRSVRR